jgi:hypothetical protein
MRVFVRQLPREVVLEELVADNPAVVPMEPGQLESDWEILQQEPASGSNGNQGRGRKRGSGNIDPTTRSIVRRIDLYAFTGQYDPVTHEALCADGICNGPSEGELGELISTQMTAANVQSNSVIVTKAGNGHVDSDDRLISCGGQCASSYEAGTAVTLTAQPSSGAVFSGWAGACSGTEPTCSVSANGQTLVYAAFSSTGSGGSSRCGLLGIEGLLPFAWFVVRRRRERGPGA